MIELNKLHGFYERNIEEYQRSDILKVTQALLREMGRPDTKPYIRVFNDYTRFKDFVWRDWLGLPSEGTRPLQKQKKAKKEKSKKHKRMSFPKLTDQSIMPYGKYKGSKMGNIPSEYLIWLWDNNACSGNVKEYIKENLEHLRLEVKQNRKMQSR